MPERCPHPACQASGSLIRWGTYQRWACTETADYRLAIQRLRCQACGRTHSLLPDFLHPYRHYVLPLLYRVTWLYLIVGLGFGRLLNHLPERGPAPATIREWVAAFAYGTGYLLWGVLSRFVLTINPHSELPGPAPPHLERSRQPQRLQQAYHFPRGGLGSGSWPSSCMPRSKGSNPGWPLASTTCSPFCCIGCKASPYHPACFGRPAWRPPLVNRFEKPLEDSNQFGRWFSPSQSR